MSYIELRPGDLAISPAARLARPAPLPPNEDAEIAKLADSMQAIGQTNSVLVQPAGASLASGALSYEIVDGARRRDAALLIERRTGRAFPLHCLVRADVADPAEAALHSNLKRRGYTPLQVAHICESIRVSKSWRGGEHTARVAAYLGVSPAYVTQHEKLLAKPEGMSDATFAELHCKLSLGRMGADAAFFALTRVKPAQADEVLQKAEQIANKRTQKGAKGGAKGELAEQDTDSRHTNARGAVKKTSPVADIIQHLQNAPSARKPRIEKRDLVAASHSLGAGVESTREAMRGTTVHGGVKYASDTLNVLRDLLRDLSDPKQWPEPMANFASKLIAFLNGRVDMPVVKNAWQRLAITFDEAAEAGAKSAVARVLAEKITVTPVSAAGTGVLVKTAKAAKTAKAVKIALKKTVAR